MGARNCLLHVGARKDALCRPKGMKTPVSEICASLGCWATLLPVYQVRSTYLTLARS